LERLRFLETHPGFAARTTQSASSELQPPAVLSTLKVKLNERPIRPESGVRSELSHRKVQK
jgi:hypothetical protein